MIGVFDSGSGGLTILRELAATLPGAEERTAEAMRAVPGLLALRAFDEIQKGVRRCE